MYQATASFIPFGDSEILRHDTKLWFGTPPGTKTGICVGAVVGLNPGSSEPGRTPGSATVDSTMSLVLSAWRDAYETLGRPLPENAYVRMWNLCYLRESRSGEFVAAISDPERFARLTSETALDPTEDEPVPGIWFAWTASAPPGLARRCLRWTGNGTRPVVFLGPDGLPHAFESEEDIRLVRHPGRKSSAQLSATVRLLLGV